VGLKVNIMCSIVSIGGGSGRVQWGSWVLLTRPVAVEKKLFLWREVLVLMDRNLLPEGRDSEYMSGGRGRPQSYCSPQGPGGVQVLERWQIAADHLLSRANYTLQSALVLGSGSSLPDGDGGGGDGLNDGGVEVHHNGLWQVEFL